MFTEQEKIDMLECFLANNKSPALAIREYRAKFPDRTIPERHIFLKIYKAFKNSGTIRKEKRNRRRSVLNEDKQLDVLLHFEENSETSTRLAAVDLSLSKTSLVRCLSINKWHPYKFQPVQKLHERDYPRRMDFCREMLQFDPNNFTKILWTDEAIFTTASGIFNRKNTYYWSSENKRKTLEVQKQGWRSVKVWCGILRNKILGPIFYEENMNSQSYLRLLENEIEDALDNLSLQDRVGLIWQQDGAPYHKSQVVQDFLNERYPVWIGQNGTIPWPPRSPDLTPLDFFVGGLKNLGKQPETNDNTRVATKIFRMCGLFKFN